MDDTALSAVLRVAARHPVRQVERQSTFFQQSGPVRTKTLEHLVQPFLVEPAMLSVDDVGALLACSARHVYRLADMGRMPRPVKLGALVRWSRSAVLDWIAAGCPNCRAGGGR